VFFMQYLRVLSASVLAVTLTAGSASRSAAQAPAAAPQQQQQMARLQNFGTMVAFVNLAAGAVRLVVVLDPASEGSEAAMSAVKSVLEKNPSKRLRAFVVWSAVTAQGTELRALARSNQVHDRRLVYFFDPEGAVSGAFRGVVGSGETPATDVVLLYDTDAHLAVSPPAPAMWMSANRDIKGETLDAKQLGAHANEMVRRVEEKVIDGTQPKQ
jgi:hypothetical protein